MAEPIWMPIAVCELGELEFPGSQHNPRIQEYLRVCGLETGDETAWCSAFVNWCMKQSGQAYTAKANARSWASYGDALVTPRYGAITVLWRGSPGSWQGHVGFFLMERGTRIKLLGGNQNNQVCAAWYPRDRVIGYRWAAPALWNKD